MIYSKYIKRLIDILCSALVMLLFWWVYLIVAVLVKVKLGSPVIFKQYRPGKKDKNGQEKIFLMYKFRTMTDAKDENGKLLPDEERTTKFGSRIRSWSIDEIPEIFNIFKGDMSIVGPRPQLVRDMVFMTDEQRKRHDVRPGLTGLAQVSGRNAISWDGKLSTDLEYIKNISFTNDVKIIFKTVKKVLVREGINLNEQKFAPDYCDELLQEKRIDLDEYNRKLEEAKEILAQVKK